MTASERCCIFCEIIAGRAEASVVYRDALICAFLDIQPVNPGHLLVVPVAHAAALDELDPEVGGRMFRVGQSLAKALRHSGLRCEGVNLFLADGVAAGQEIFHTHLHVFPRFDGDGFGLRHPAQYHVLPSRAVLDETAKTIRSAMDAKHVALRHLR